MFSPYFQSTEEMMNDNIGFLCSSTIQSVCNCAKYPGPAPASNRPLIITPPSSKDMKILGSDKYPRYFQYTACMSVKDKRSSSFLFGSRTISISSSFLIRTGYPKKNTIGTAFFVNLNNKKPNKICIVWFFVFFISLPALPFQATPSLLPPLVF